MFFFCLLNNGSVGDQKVEISKYVKQRVLILSGFLCNASHHPQTAATKS
jgi:hypothetical protein